MKALISRGVKITNNYLILALKNDYLQLSKFLLKQGLIITTPDILRYCLDNNKYHVIDLLIARGLHIPADTLINAAANNLVNTVRILLMKGFTRGLDTALQTTNPDRQPIIHKMLTKARINKVET
jgi:hypothetical protein